MVDALIFYVLSGVCLATATYTVMTPRAAYGVLSLLLAMFALSGLFALLGAQFLAAIQILIYAGAILVLFLFVLMLIGFQRQETARYGWPKALLVCLVVLSLLYQILLLAGTQARTLPVPENGDVVGTVQTVGRLLFAEYVLPFEIISLILLAAVLGVVYLAGKTSSR